MALPALALALLAPGVAAASPQVMIERAGPPVPTPRSRPCEVQLFDAAALEAPDLFSYTFTPPAACPPPWAKVVLSMDLTDQRVLSIRGLAVALKDVTLFVGPTPSTMESAHWHVERDLTDYSALFRRSGAGTVTPLYAYRDGYLYDSPEGHHMTAVATLRFYPATAAQPAPRVPDAVFPAYTALVPPFLTMSDPSAAASDLDALPHNIERAYLDVTANDDAFWYSCLPQRLLDAHPTLGSPIALGLAGRGIFPAGQGCVPNSYSEARVTVDGTPAGVAPVFPWLPTDFSNTTGPILPVFWNALDAPTDSSQSLDFVPWRVDLTPFAAILNEAGTHRVSLHMPERMGAGGLWFLPPANANLLVYLDNGRARVPGAVTYNSLATSKVKPRVTDDLVQDGDVLHGRVRTRLDRSFEIRGYVDTSHGRIHSAVEQTAAFKNVEQFEVRDSLKVQTTRPRFRQDIWLSTSTRSTSRRTRAGQVLSEDRQDVSYPLELHYVGKGRMTRWYDPNNPTIDLFGGSVSVDQKRISDVHHYRHGLAPYATHLREEFYGSHRIDPDTQASSDWKAVHTYDFHDNRNGCYQKAVITQAGVLDDVATGVGCPSGSNHLRWYAHPDGAADGLTWMQP
ncbi:peptide-N4-asparagine amidase [Frateuria soli]|uniref:peptide-N4-asparagine amidase n=1 Tax=Frateuria soli TaxID=1542730 RepID=UPI001E5997BC|nr:peptide-N4-asparagine amidase [Frateuria soli]UGB38326.1 hypothetical protein LQ771_00250 [Frateuria soli]